MTTTTTTTTTTDTSPPIIIGVAQLRATNHKVHNLLEITKCVAWAKQKGAQMIFLPECAGFMGAAPGETLQKAEAPIGEEQPNAECVTEWIHKMYEHTLLQESSTVEEEQQPSDTVAALASEAAAAEADSTVSNVSLMHGLSTLAKLAQMWISVGGLHVRGAPPHDGKERFYNTHVILDDTGTVKAIYRKIHLFDVCIPGKVNLMESNSTAPGRDIVVCDTPVGRLGLSTCYDMRFPELYAELVQRGAQILLMPSAFTVPTGQAHWHILLRARAIECQTFVVAAAQYGQHNPKRASYGHSLVVDPWGVVLADAGGVDNEAPVETSLVTAEIDLQQIDSIRQRMPVQQHRAAANQHVHGDENTQ